MSDDVLLNQVEENRKKLKTDGYKMSVGEISSLYKDGEININPEFQRYFRWNDVQKSRLVESILLGIPIPPIYVSQLESGQWEVIDGLQRLSTLLQFFGELRNQDNELYEPLVLNGTKLLPSLEGFAWNAVVGTDTKELPKNLKLAFKRSGLNIEIINQESDPSSKYELFQRLNTLGTSLSAQEVRNCLLIMLNRPMFIWLEEISKHQAFLDTIALSDRNLEQRYESELALRLFALLAQPYLDNEWHKKEVEEVITEKSIEIATSTTFDFDSAKKRFIRTFDYINGAVEDESFKKYYDNLSRFKGQFLVSAFECIAIGVFENIDAIEQDSNYDLRSRLIAMWSDPTFNQFVSRGVRATDRIKNIVPYGKNHFRP